jgi:hypothetical protein
MNKLLIDKSNYKMIKIATNKYSIEFDITNNNIILNKVLNLDFINLVCEINKGDILDNFKLEKHNIGAMSLYVEFNHFFDDFGISKKYSYLDIIFEKWGDKIIYKAKTPELISLSICNTKLEIIPIKEVVATCTLINPHKAKIQILTEFKGNVELPEFIEKMGTTIISKIFLRTKQFIEKIDVNNIETTHV